ncbi:trithorax group protein osa-like [Odontomachus brunneus]|uniref:trithorax group protein osa-like n=1 Tax=Odontomachus brunneus TaxID=486640 RepID=UPI0013F22A84|nr:trithorax group protein osa-like [Odontomachus brunneus]
MAKFKMLFVLFCVLLIGHHVQAVVHKTSSQTPLAKEEEKPGKAKADDRISNTFASPAEDYGLPSGSAGFNGPAPVYGPPELVGNLRPTPIYPPPPAELPPPIFGTPAVSYGLPPPPPPRTIKPQYGPPLKQSFASTSLLAKPSYSPPKLHYGLPKQHFTPPSALFPSFKLPKPHYALPPLKLVGTSSQQYIPPSATSQHGPLKPGHGPPIPISLETYGPPPAKLAIQFNPLPNDEYGPPPPPAPQPQYGPPAGDLYEPPLPAPPPGVPAPPTPPDIKYDGWQPIAGLASSPNQSGPPTDTYGPPTEVKHNYVEASTSSGTHLSHASLSVPTNSNVPSDSYGVPIHNPEAQDLKTSVHQSSASSESNGLPPPPLPQQEPLHNNQGPGVVAPTGHAGHADHQAGLHQQQQLGLQYSAPNIEPLSIVKTVGFELLPTTGGALGTDLQGLSLSGGTSDVSSFNHITSSVNANSASLHSGLELTPDNGGSHAIAPGNDGDSHGFQNTGVDLSLQQLPQPTPSSDYGAPLNTFGKHGGVSSPALLSPPPLDSYGAPPLSSYSPNGPYPVAQGGRITPLFSSFGLFGGSFHKQNLHHPKIHAPIRPPPVPPGSLIPPRNREPVKFREPIPIGLLSNINRYVPPFTKQKLHGPSIPLGQQLPSYHAPTPFRYVSGPALSGSFSSAGSHSDYSVNSPVAAPHVQYGTPLSFTDFNTPAPHLTYGAPNFGPPTSYVSTFSGFDQNLYSDIGNNALTMTYGTPNAPLPINGDHDCNSLQPLFPPSGGLPLSGSSPLNRELHSSGEAHLSAGLSSGGGVPSSEELSLGGRLHEGAHSDGKLQVAFENAVNPVGHAEDPAPFFTNSLSTGFASPAGDDHLSPIYRGHSLPTKPFDNFLAAPSVNTLDLQYNEQQKINLKDSYGNPVGVTYDAANEASNSKIVHATTPDVSNELSVHTSSQTHYPVATSFQQDGMSAEAFTASLTAREFSKKVEKSLGSNEVDADQFLKSSEGSEALSLAQGLTANDAGNFEVHGSRGTYTLQIQPADGGLGTENADGSIRHDQVLSNGLLQDILAAIERPENDPVQFQGPPESQLLKVFDNQAEGTSMKGHFIGALENYKLPERNKQATNEKEKYKTQPVALFYNHKYDDT